MASFEIAWKRSAVKELRKLPSDIMLRIIAAVEGLAEEPHPIGARKLQGSEHTFRIREGAYRVIYEVDAKAVTITIVTVAHRREAYRR